MSAILHPRKISEGFLIFILASVQFINIVDFMMVIPMGPDFSNALGIRADRLALIGAIYMFAAFVSGVCCSFLIDNYDRKKILLTFMAGLVVATFLCSIASNLYTLLLARFFAGLFGGPMLPIAIAIISDNVPPERRGAAIGKVMGSFSAASVIGVPFGLELAHRFDWKAPFITISAVATFLMIIAVFKLPDQKHYIVKYKLSHRMKILKNMFTDKLAIGACLFMSFFFMSAFMVIPNMAAHMQFNMGFPREDMGMLYMCGGVVSFFTMIFSGKMTDKYGSAKVTLVSVFLMTFVLLIFCIFYNYIKIPVIVLFTLFMIVTSTRNVSGQTLASKIPKPTERAGFQSILSSIIHLSCAVGSFFSSLILTGDLNHINNMEYVGVISILISWIALYTLFLTEKGLKKAM